MPPPSLGSPIKSVRQSERFAAFIVLGFVLVLLLFINGGAWFALANLQTMLEAELESRLITTGQTAATVLRGEDFLILDATNEEGALDVELIRVLRDDPAYLRLLALLERVRDAAALRSISIVTAEARVVADPEDPDLVGETRSLLFLDSAEIKEAAAGLPAACALYPVGDMLYKRVYVPLANDEGSIVALLRLEASSEYFVGLRRLRAFLVAFLAASTAILLVVSLVLYRLIRRLLLTERVASQADRLRSLGTLAAGLAHEIRNPLAIIRLTCEELRPALHADQRPSDKVQNSLSKTEHAASDAASDEEESAEILLKDIQDEVLRLESLVEQFLSFARPEASQSAFAAGKPADPLAVARNVARLFEKSLRVTKSRLKTCLPETPLPRVFLNEKGLTQVLLNLLRNAAEAMPVSGGTITLSLRQTANRNVEISVDDTGPGMSESVRRQAFEPFFSTKENGTGLGLSLVYRLVTSARGRIELESRQGKGTTVRVLLPTVELPGKSANRQRQTPAQ